MTDIGFRLTGRIPAQLFDSVAVVEQVTTLINTTLEDIKDKGQQYPPPPPKSKYKRTYTLRNSWHIQDAHNTGDAIKGSVYNTATDKWGRHYASFVFGSSEMSQAPVHQGRWPTKDQLFDRHAFDVGLRAIIAGRGGLQ